MLHTTVWSSFLWSSSTWIVAKALNDKIASWSARVVSRIAGLRRPPHQEMDQWWRLLHRHGHKLIAKHQVDLPSLVRTRRLRWAGRLARMHTTSPAAAALRCRCLPWWRWCQSDHKKSGDKWSGPHPRRFKIYRWEEQIAAEFGEGFSSDVHASTG